MARVWSPVPWHAVRIEDGFWAPLQARMRAETLPAEYRQCVDSGRIPAFRLDWSEGQPRPHFFWDSDVAKWVEAASYSLATHPDPALAAQLDQVVALVVSAQQPDGYLNVYFTVVEPGARWSDLRDAHELYCAGHLIEAGVAHFEGTGSTKLLHAVTRLAAHIGTVFGRGPGQRRGYCGHPEIELALVRLWRATGDRRHLDLASYFVDERGRSPSYWQVEQEARGGTPGHSEGFMRSLRDPARHSQSHAPVREQREAVGHAVRAMYLYSAMADLAGCQGDGELASACEALWEDVTTAHMYVTGAVGSSAANEGFTSDHDLPNASAYGETCATVGLCFFASRMLQLGCDGRYADVLERALFNGAISGVSGDGRSFFYANPLASDGAVHRRPWFDCACCPPNLARLVTSLGGYTCSVLGEAEVAIHLYMQGRTRLRLGGAEVTLHQRGGYPWDGHIRVAVEMAAPADFALRLRIPGWCRAATLACGGEPLPLQLTSGYARLQRRWHPGDEVELTFPLPVERIYASPAVVQDAGRVALQRGPVVYCLESADQPGVPLESVLLPRGAVLDAEAGPPGTPVAVVADGEREVAAPGALGPVPPLYRFAPAARLPQRLRAIPYFAWDNRAPGAMRVWIREA